MLVLRLNPKTLPFEGCSPDTHTAAAPLQLILLAECREKNGLTQSSEARLTNQGFEKSEKASRQYSRQLALGGTSEEYKESSAGARMSSRSWFREGCSKLDFCSLLTFPGSAVSVVQTD